MFQRRQRSVGSPWLCPHVTHQLCSVRTTVGKCRARSWTFARKFQFISLFSFWNGQSDENFQSCCMYVVKIVFTDIFSTIKGPTNNKSLPALKLTLENISGHFQPTFKWFLKVPCSSDFHHCVPQLKCWFSENLCNVTFWVWADLFLFCWLRKGVEYHNDEWLGVRSVKISAVFLNR